MRERISHVLRIARAHGHRDLVLGAYGCGVFHQHPYEVATWFRQALDDYHGTFRRVVFAIRGPEEGFHIDSFRFALLGPSSPTREERTFYMSRTARSYPDSKTKEIDVSIPGNKGSRIVGESGKRTRKNLRRSKYFHEHV